MPDGDMFDVVSKELEDRAVVATAKLRYSQTSSYQAQLRSHYTRLHHYYAPLNGDAAVDRYARLGMPPLAAHPNEHASITGIMFA